MGYFSFICWTHTSLDRLSVMTAHLQYSFLSSLVEQLFSVGQAGVHVRGAAASEPGMGTQTPVTMQHDPVLSIAEIP